MRAEEGFSWLRRQAADHVEDLIAAFEAEADHGVRCWLLELIGEARSETAFDLLCEQAMANDESLKSWAVRGLDLLGTKAARTFMFKHGLNQ